MSIWEIRDVLDEQFSVERSSIRASSCFLKGLVNYHVVYIIVLATVYDPAQAAGLQLSFKIVIEHTTSTISLIVDTEKVEAGVWPLFLLSDNSCCY